MLQSPRCFVVSNPVYSASEFVFPTLRPATIAPQRVVPLHNRTLPARQIAKMTREHPLPMAALVRRALSTKYAETRTTVTSTTKPKMTCAPRKRS